MKHTHQKDHPPTKAFSRFISWMLVCAMLLPMLPLQSLAATVGTNDLGQMVVTDSEGNIEVVDESWETRFPYGTFAFGEAQLVLTEGDDTTVKLTLHRLGGTEGRAEADIVLMPGATVTEDGSLSYTNAAGNRDYGLEMELPQPIAYYQPLGGVAKPYVASGLAVTLDYNLLKDNVMDMEQWPPAVLEYGEQVFYVPAEGTENTFGKESVPVAADSYRWQMRDQLDENAEWEDVGENANEAFLAVSNEIIYSEDVWLDFRLIYTADGVTYCSTSYFGEEYQPPESDVDPVPEDFENDFDPGFTAVELTGEEFDVQGITVIFAEGEEKKELVFSVKDDDIAEADEFVLINILQARGATLYDSANTISLRITDNEKQEPSIVGFAVTEAQADKAEGTVRLTVTRTGGTQYPVTVPYTITEGTAKLGADYAGVQGTAYFAPGMAETYIDIALIQDGEPIAPEDGLTLTVTLDEVQGGGENSAVAEGKETLTLTLYMSETEVEEPNLPTVLHNSDADDVSGDVAVADGSIVGITGGAPSVTPVQKPEEIEGVLVTPVQGRSYLFTENGAAKVLTFARGDDYAGYWKDWENILYRPFTYIRNDYLGKVDGASTISYNWSSPSFRANDDESMVEKNQDGYSSGGNSFPETINGTRAFVFDQGGVTLEHNSSAKGNNLLTINDAGNLYKSVYVLGRIVNWGVDQVDSDGKNLVVLPGIEVKKGNGNSVAKVEWNSVDAKAGHSGNGYFSLWGDYNGVLRSLEEPREASGSLSFGDDVKVSMWLDRYKLRDGSKVDYDTDWNHAYYTTAFLVHFLQFERRVFDKQLFVMAHTANDADVVEGNAQLLSDAAADAVAAKEAALARGEDEAAQAAAAASRTPAILGQANYANLFPTVSLVTASSGITEDGRLYVGSKLRIKLGNSAAYDPVTSNDLPVVYLTDEEGKIIKTATVTASEEGKVVYELELLWNGISQADLTKQYTLNVAMARKQNFVVQYGTSLTNEKGTRTSNEAANEFLAGNITYGAADYSVTKSDNTISQSYEDYFVYSNNKTLATPQKDTTAHTLTYSTQNVYWVNFGQDKEDKILYGGNIYDGDETIWLHLSDLQNTSVVFTWYDSEYLTATSTMQPTIARMERYLDIDGDGRVEGTYDTETGVFTPENDLYLGAFMPGITMEITMLDPMLHPDNDDEETYYQQIVKVYYNKVPRSLNPQAAAPDNYAQIVPYITTGITNESLLSTLSDPERSVRYLRTTEDAEIYGAAAQKLAMVDVPFGGDHKPPVRVENGQKTEWVWASAGSGYRGWLLQDYKSLSPIKMRATMLGSDVPVVSTGIVQNQDGSYTMTDTAKSILNNYLGSLNADDTFGIAVREMQADATPLNYEASAASGLVTFPDASTVQAFSGAAGSAEGDPNESGNPMGEFNIDTGIELPTFEIGLTDYVTIIMDGYEVGFSIGIPLTSAQTKFKKDGNDKNIWKGPDNPKEANTQALNDLKDAMNPKQEIKNKYDKLKQKANSALPSSVAKSKSFSVSIGFNLSILFKYNPLDNGYYFSQASFLLTCSMSYTFTVRLTVCPLIFAYFSVGMTVNGGASINADRVKAVADTLNLAQANGNAVKLSTSPVHKSGTLLSGTAPQSSDGSIYYWTQQEKLGPDGKAKPENKDMLQLASGATLSYTGKYKALDIRFSGRFLITSDIEGFTGGVLTSDGSEPITVKLTSDINGFFDEAHTVTFTALPEKENGTPMYTYVDTITPIEKVGTNVTFGGIEINPSLYVEIGAGIGVEVLKVEIFAKVSIAFAFAVAPQASGDTAGDVDTDPFRFTYFELAASLGIRAVLLFFDIEFEGIKISITYDWADRIKQASGWAFTVYLGGQTMYSADLKRSMTGGDAAEELTVTVRPPVDLSTAQRIYKPEDNAVNPNMRALDPTDANVPFQLSGFGSSGDAFALADGLQSGGDFRLVTLGGETYIAYIVSRSGAVNSIDATQLVLSKIQNTAMGTEAVYGLVHPVDAASQQPYLVIDDDLGGDLEFSAYADEENGSIDFVWTTYNGVSAAPDSSAENQAAAAAKNVVVKTASVTLSGNAAGVSAPVLVTGGAGSYRFIPMYADGLIFFGETVHFTDKEIEARNEEYLAAYNAVETGTAVVGGEQVVYTQDDPSGYYMRTQSQVMDSVYGKTTALRFAVPDRSGRYEICSFTAKDWSKKGTRLESAELVKVADRKYYLAYVTATEDLIDKEESIDAYRKGENTPVSTQGQTRTIRQLYLQEVKIALNGTPELGKAALLRSLVDYKDNTLMTSSESPLDGLYSDSTLVTSYQDPYITNLRFLYGKLGTLTGTEENFTEAIEFDRRTRDIGDAVSEKHFLLFEMNGETYIIPEESLASITGEKTEERKGYIIPFFGTAEGTAEGVGTTIGVDGNGTITAVYTKSVTGTSNNALYMTKYDAASGTWGVGTMLAMHNMDVYEKVESEYATMDEIESYYYDPAFGGSMDSFVFRELDIALGGAEELVVVTRGTLTEMAENTMYKTVYATDSDGLILYDGDGKAIVESIEENGTIIEPARDSSGNLVSNTGTYVISYGVGQQTLTSPSIDFIDWNLAAGAELVPTVSFTNGGDVAIRAGSKDADGASEHPISVKLLLGTLSTDGTAVTSAETLAEWLVQDSIRAGMSVTADDIVFTMPTGAAGKVMYMQVAEADYFASTPMNSLAYDRDGKITDGSACILIEDKPELYFRKIDTAIAGAEDGKASVRLDATAVNLGTANAEAVYLRVQAVSEIDSDGNKTLVPVDLTDHNLDISLQKEMRSSTYTLANGYLLLARTGEDASTAGRLNAGMGREISGTFPLDNSLFIGEDNSAELCFSLVISGDDGTSEFTYANNTIEKLLSSKTFFTVATDLALTLGSTLRLPLGVTSASGRASSITVTDLPTEDENGEVVGKLGALYYDSSADALVISAIKEGDGVIRISDETTNSSVLVYYTVRGAGEGINFFNDNEIFDWSEDPAWDFYPYPGSWGDYTAGPLRYDIAEGELNATVSFDSYAESIDFYFEGEIEVRLSSMTLWTLTSENGNAPQTVDFGANNNNSVRNITVKVKKEGTMLDCYTETFTDLDAVLTTGDPLAPTVYWSRSFPQAASVKAGETVEMTLYIVDDSGIGSVTAMLDGNALTLAQGSVGEQLWSIPVTFNKGGNFSLTATDTAGNRSTTTFSVTWFNNAEGAVTTDNAYTMSTRLTDPEGNNITPSNKIRGGEIPKVIIRTDSPAENATLAIFQVQTAEVASEEVPVAQGFVTQGSFPVENGDGSDNVTGGSGIYMVEVVEADGSFIRHLFTVEADAFNTSYPKAMLSLVERQGKRVLSYKASCVSSRALVSATVSGPNGFTQTIEIGEQVKEVEGFTDEIFVPGEYTLTVEDNYYFPDNNKTSVTIAVENDPVIAAIETVTHKTYLANGAFTLDVAGGYNGAYLYAIREKGSTEDFSFADASVLQELDGGTYEICVCDAYDLSNTSEVLEAKIADIKVMIADGIEYGSISVSPENVLAGDTVTVTATPVAEYYLTALSAADEYGAVTLQTVTDAPKVESVYSFTMPESTVTVSAVFAEIPKYPIDIATDIENGSVTVTPTLAKEGDVVTLTVTPDQGYLFADITVTDANGNDIPVTQADETTYSFIMPDVKVDVDADFAEDNAALVAVLAAKNRKYDILSATENGGRITPEGTTKVKRNNDMTYVITPAEGYAIASVTVDGRDMGAISVYTFTDVAADHTIVATFKSAWVNPFTDVTGEDWFYDDVRYVNENGLMLGVEDTLYGPSLSTTRAMIVTILWRLEGSPAVESTVKFADVADNAWFAAPIRWASANGIVLGYGNDLFGPDDPITREQVAAIFQRYVTYKGMDDSIIAASAPQYTYSDWAEKNIVWAKENGLLDGIGVDISDMRKTASRAEIAAYLHRFCEAYIAK